MREISSAHLKDLVLRTIEVYNRYRSPETKATLVSIKNDSFILEFEGSFCKTCGVRDYFEDFIYELETINSTIRLEIGETEPSGPQSFRVQYRIKEESSKLKEDILFQEFLLDRGLSFEEYLAFNSCTKDVILFHFRTWIFERKQSSEK